MIIISSLFRTTCIAVLCSLGTMIPMEGAHVNPCLNKSSSFDDDRLGLAQADSTNAEDNTAGRPQERDVVEPNLQADRVALKGYDPVGYFKQGKPVKGRPSIRSKYQEITYFFASLIDKADFEENPMIFVPQYGGFCAYHFGRHQAIVGDPNIFYIYKGKLYIFSNQEALKSFGADPESYIKKADTNWQFYQLPTSPGFRREIQS